MQENMYVGMQILTLPRPNVTYNPPRPQLGKQYISLWHSVPKLHHQWLHIPCLPKAPPNDLGAVYFLHQGQANDLVATYPLPY